MRSSARVSFFALLLVTTIALNPSCQPDQIHLSLGDAYYSASRLNDLRLPSEIINDNQAYLVWQTQDLCQFSLQVTEAESQKIISKDPVDYYDEVVSNSNEHEDHSNNGIFQTTIYTALLEDLVYDKAYQYTILDQNEAKVAGPFNFSLANPRLSNTSRKILFMGGLDDQKSGSVTIDEINSLVASRADDYAGIIQVGDIASYSHKNNDTNGNAFFNIIQSSASILPLTLTSEAHGELPSKHSFMSHQIRNPLFNMTHNNYFSFNIQGIHFVSINLEFFENGDEETQMKMLSWIENDLNEANTDAQRALWPWTIVLVEPIYNNDASGETKERKQSYKYYEPEKTWESLFAEHKVDLIISGHNYNNEKVYTSDSVRDLINPAEPWYIYEGNVIANTNTSCKDDAKECEKFIDTDPAYGVLYTESSTEGLKLIYEQYFSDTGDKIGYVTLTKTKPPTELVVNNETRSTVPWIFALIGAAVAIVVGVLVWKRMTRKDPEVEKLRMSEYRSSKIYGGRNSENAISMVDLVL